jgi:hypothetical protein
MSQPYRPPRHLTGTALLFLLLLLTYDLLLGLSNALFPAYITFLRIS